MQTTKMKGLTLVELMVMLIVMAILVAVALPSYQEYVLKGKRAEGRSALLRIMQQQERHYSLHARYLSFSAGAASDDVHAAGFRWYSGDHPKTSLYEISAHACDGKDIRDCVKLVATPGTQNVNSDFRDPTCGTLVLTSEGERSARVDHCW